MLFHVFASQEERRVFGGSYFIEMQFCALPHGTLEKDIVAVDNIKNWENDSLYINDDELFYKEYSRIFNGGIYNNGKRGTVDVFGINYYPPSLTEDIIKKISEEKPADFEVLLAWLNRARAYNGFYILGI
ncbi:MAG: hypothetical protein E7608_06070 [Ruminococcaceae bacterium]|nr:hypothetical protein [Oscillospiraceae bacterium]